MEEKQMYDYQYHGTTTTYHHQYPHLLENKRLGVERREEEPQKHSHTLIYVQSVFDQ